jgi:hypothetical protein
MEPHLRAAGAIMNACATSFSGIANFMHSKDICVKNRFERINNFSTQRLRGPEGQRTARTARRCYGNGNGDGNGDGKNSEDGKGERMAWVTLSFFLP